MLLDSQQPSNADRLQTNPVTHYQPAARCCNTLITGSVLPQENDVPVYMIGAEGDS